MLSTVLSVIALGASAYAAIISTVAWNNTQRAANFSKRLAAVESELTENTDQIHAYGASLKKLRSRITMRATRQNAANGADTTEVTDKAKLRDIARERGLL